MSKSEEDIVVEEMARIEEELAKVLTRGWIDEMLKLMVKGEFDPKAATKAYEKMSKKDRAYAFFYLLGVTHGLIEPEEPDNALV